MSKRSYKSEQREHLLPKAGSAIYSETPNIYLPSNYNKVSQQVSLSCQPNNNDYTIRISTSLIEQLARDDEKQVKRRTRKPKPRKVVEQPEEPRDNGRELPTEPKSSPAPVLPFPPPMYLPVTPARDPGGGSHIRAAESEKVLEKLQKKEATMREELTKRAKELHDKEFKLPYQNPSPCTDERAGCAECYRSNVQDPLKCAEAVKRFEACVRMARRGGGAMGAAQ